MQAATPNMPTDTRPQIDDVAPSVRISLEWVAYFALIAFVVLVRVADIDIVPMGDVEARQALSTWHVLHPNAPGEAALPNSPILFWTQAIFFETLGGTDAAARLSGMIAGVLLALTPLILRDRIGRTQTFALSLIFALAPIPLVAARTSDPALWSAVFAAAGLATFWRWWEDRQLRDGLLASAAFAALALLSGPDGIVLALVLLISGGLTVWWLALRAPQALEIPGEDVLSGVRDGLRAFPWRWGASVAVLVVIALSTGFMLYPNGLTHVSESFGVALARVLQPFVTGAPVAYAPLTLLVYDALLIIFGIVGALLALRAERVHFADRFAVVWALTAFVVLLLYRGAGPAYALWLVLPLAWLTSRLVEPMLVTVPVTVYWLDDPTGENDDVFSLRYGWVKWVLALLTLGLLVTMGLHWQEVGRGLLLLPAGLSPGEVFNTVFEPAFAQLRYSFIWLIITVLFFGVGFLLAASIWGNINALQGVGLGAFAFLLGSGLGGGWNAAVVNASDPAEVWYVAATSPDALLLREALFDVAGRDTAGFPLVPVSVVEDPDSGIRRDGVVAWLLRDFENAVFVGAVENARREQIVITPGLNAELDLGGAYVGQSIAIGSTLPVTLSNEALPVWLSMRRVRPGLREDQTAILWLRQDVYDGLPVEERP